MLGDQASERYRDLINKIWEGAGFGHSHQCTGQDLLNACNDQDLCMKMLERFPGTQGGNLSGIVNRSEFEEVHFQLASVSPVDEYTAKAAQKIWKGV